MINVLAARIAHGRFRGDVIESRGYSSKTIWRCPHKHKYKDCALHCAGKQSRRMR